MRGKRTSPKMAVHSWWSADASSGERREFWRQAKAWWRISRQGLRHWERRASKIGDQYANHAVQESERQIVEKNARKRTFVPLQVRLLDESRYSVR